MIRMTQIKVPVERLLAVEEPELVRHGIIGGEEERLVRQAAADALRIHPEKIQRMVIRRKSIDARKKQRIQYIYQVDLSVSGERSLCKRYGKNDAKIIEDNASSGGQKGRGEASIPLPAGSRETDAARQGANVVGRGADAVRRGANVVGRGADAVRRGANAGGKRPVVAGMGPAGIFAALELARAGRMPIVLERGAQVDQRQKIVEHFWETGELNPHTNVQFGEGGAGTFSDGKLNTLVKDTEGRGRKVLETFVEYGAPPEILYLQKPHIGTDRLREVVKNIRQEIIALGGEVFFETELLRAVWKENRLQEVIVREQETGQERVISCDVLILATGHSARNTFTTLYQDGLKMESKAFALGVRVEHPQEMIGMCQYGDYYDRLPAADYKLTYTAQSGRGVYSFCMCPGGFVVNASSEAGRLAVNGMSNYDRDSANANSAIVVTVAPEVFAGSLREAGMFYAERKAQDRGDVICEEWLRETEQGIHPLAGLAFQRIWEEAAFRQCDGAIPVQLMADYLENRASTGWGDVRPCMKGKYRLGNVRQILPAALGDDIAEGLSAFGRRIRGYDREDALLSGIESRTSSPVRIPRGDDLQSSVRGIYPCGEGAGYAGGITSAAMDGIRVAQAVLGVNH